jgi:hypothetical protein
MHVFGTQWRLCLTRLLVGAGVFGYGFGARADSTLIKSTPDHQSQTTSNATSGPSRTRFQRLAPDETGIDFQIIWEKPAAFDRIFYSQNTGGGVCIGDYDGDQLPDVYLTRPSKGNRLYRNLGNLRFADVTDKTGLRDDDFWGTGASFVDIDNDGDLDLYVCGYSCPNRLYLNEGDGTFVDIAAASRLHYNGASVMMAFADYDQDGDLDGYLVTAGLPPGPKQPFRVYFDKKDVPRVLPELREYWQLLYLPGEKAKQIEAGQFDHLYRNDGRDAAGRPKFTDVTKESGIDGTDLGQAATWWDYDADGDSDLYVANDYWGSDKLYRNNGNGTFTDVAKESLPHTPWSSMGVDVADINRDGWLDFIATDMAGSNHFRQKVGMGDMSNSGWFLEFAEPRQYSRNSVYLNTGTNRFMEIAYMVGVEASDWTWTPRFDDFDNDGLMDLIITNGMTRDFTNSDLNEIAKRNAKEGSPEFFRFWRKQEYRKDQNLAYRNLGDLKFQDVSHEWGFDRVGVSFGAATGDLDRDGDLDIVVNNMDSPAHVYRNDGTTGNSIRIALRGTASNRMGLGATVTATIGTESQTQYMTLARGWTSNSEPILHFGIGRHQHIDRLEVIWPGGRRQTVPSLKANQVHTIQEPAGRPAAAEQADSRRTQFIPTDHLRLAASHAETPYDDYSRQPLLPNKMSQLGPGLACGDVNGDGRVDLYLPGAADQSGQLVIQSSDGQFEPREVPDFATDKRHEDLGALFFDADGDGDQDLYVVSGGVECEPDHWLLEDRLYLNDGAADFKRAIDALPGDRASGSVVSAADFDRDGDLDLFVGGRVVPGQYPTPARSLLLRNENGQFSDVADEIAKGLSHSGMVTSALWTDVNLDGWSDLLVTYEWGPVRCFRNRSGTFVDATEEAGLGKRTGWWNGIAGRDLDQDGDIDYVVTNFGLNTKYHASTDHPTRLYYGDFDGSGKLQIVEAEHEEGHLFPVRGRSCSTNAMPFLARKFTSFTAFGAAELDEIYTTKCLSEAKVFAANTLESGILINDGKGRFEFRPLPRIAQASPAFGVSLSDVDADGDADIYLVQNFYSPQRETGFMNGGVSLLLLNNGRAEFEPVWPNRSGLVVPGDAKSVTAIDLDADGADDFIIGVNNGPWQTFTNQWTGAGKRLRVHVRGKPGNPTSIGSVVRVTTSDGRSQQAEISAGGGYLSQAAPYLDFGCPAGADFQMIHMRWSDSGEKSMQPPQDVPEVTIQR